MFQLQPPQLGVGEVHPDLLSWSPESKSNTETTDQIFISYLLPQPYRRSQCEDLPERVSSTPSVGMTPGLT